MQWWSKGFGSLSDRFDAKKIIVQARLREQKIEAALLNGTLFQNTPQQAVMRSAAAALCAAEVLKEQHSSPKTLDADEHTEHTSSSQHFLYGLYDFFFFF